MGHSWFANWRRWLGAFVALFSSNAFAMSNPGYLPCVGPTALRFVMPARPSTNHFVLPAPVLVPIPVAVKPDKTPETNAPAPIVVPVTDTNTVSPRTSPEPLPTPQALIGPGGTDGVISPQMLLKFFNKAGATNSPDAAADSRKSSATYTIGQ